MTSRICLGKTKSSAFRWRPRCKGFAHTYTPAFTFPIEGAASFDHCYLSVHGMCKTCHYLPNPG
eukprot:5941564-Amphidinium_carterae.1